MLWTWSEEVCHALRIFSTVLDVTDTCTTVENMTDSTGKQSWRQLFWSQYNYDFQCTFYGCSRLPVTLPVLVPVIGVHGSTEVRAKKNDPFLHLFYSIVFLLLYSIYSKKGVPANTYRYKRR